MDKTGCTTARWRCCCRAVARAGSRW
jgi:hypothetical protein